MSHASVDDAPLRSRLGPVWGAALIAVATATGCSLMFDLELREYAEFGAACRRGDDCVSELCELGRCTVACTDECPAGARCGTDRFCVFDSPLPIGESVSIGLLYDDAVEDYGWTKAHDQGRAYLQSKIKSATTEVADLSPSRAAEQIDAWVTKGHNVIVGTHPSFLTAIQNGALRYPTTNFLICDGFQTGPNLGSYFGRMYQVAYMAGQLAARSTETDTVGVIGPVVTPETVVSVNAFAQGVHAFAKSTRVMVRWTEYWSNDAESEDAIEDLAAAGADVVFAYVDSLTPLQRAGSLTAQPGGEPVRVIGYNNENVCDVASRSCLGAAYWNWGPLYVRMIQEMIDGEWVPTNVVWDRMYGDREESSVYISVNAAAAPAGVSLAIEGLIPELARADQASIMLPFAGPLNDNSGEQRIPAGSYPTDTDLLRMCWFVQGVLDVDGTPAEMPLECDGDR